MIQHSDRIALALSRLTHGEMTQEAAVREIAAAVVQVRRMGRTLDEIAADAMEDARLPESTSAEIIQFRPSRSNGLHPAVARELGA